MSFDHEAYLEQALIVLALRLRHEVALHRALRGDGAREGFGGLLLDGEEAERMLAEMAGRLAVSGTAESMTVLAGLEDSLAEARAQRGSVWARLAAVFPLPPLALELITLAAAPAIDPRYGRVYGFLSDDLGRRHLTPALAHRLLQHHGLGLSQLRAMLAPEAPLVAWGLIALGPERPLIEAPIRLDEAMVDLLLGDRPWPDEVPPTLEAGPWIGLPDDASRARLAEITGRRPRETALTSLGLHVDPATHWRTRARQSALEGELPVLLDRGAPSTSAARQSMAQALGPGQALLTDDPQGWLATGLAATFVTGDGVSAPEALERDRALSGLAQRVRPRLAFDDLVLTARARVALEDLAVAFSEMQPVLDGWSFGRVWGRGRGLTALFKGPSGTGKTSAAGAVALRLGLPLYRVNLAGLTSKYIGETEKHLDRLFTVAEGRDLVLFFDEADAAFGKRTQVTDAHDRYANLGTAFLLQRLETHSGLTVLATNLQENIDEAFLRRIDAVIEFPATGRDEREALWRRLLATDAPLGDLDFAALAEHQLTGGEIRNACLSAAWRSSAAGTPITMEGLARAIALELAKKGRPVRRSAFGDLYSAGREGR
ncbi:MAG TPA: ATP-binding protein [Arachnia sp.]|nr:ATP-binding protein [Arachnia sp.]HMT85296.1 ATP-binding protein [Arachnia sp.]